jgi:hypothetical protein
MTKANSMSNNSPGSRPEGPNIPQVPRKLPRAVVAGGGLGGVGIFLWFVFHAYMSSHHEVTIPTHHIMPPQSFEMPSLPRHTPSP